MHLHARRLDMATLLCRLLVILMAVCSHALHNESSVGVTEAELSWTSLRRSWGRRGLVGAAGVAGCSGDAKTVDGCTNMLTSSTTLSACRSYCCVSLFTLEMFSLPSSLITVQ